MKKSIILLMFCAIQSVNSTPHLKPEVHERHRVDSSMKALLDRHKDELIKAFEKCDLQVCIKLRRVYEFPWLPGYLVKTLTSRIIGAERLLSCIKKHNLDLIVIPEKRIYEVDGHEFIIVPKIEASSSSPLTLRQVQQLWKIIEETRYYDLYPRNYLLMADDKLAIIDTERISFLHRRINELAKFRRFANSLLISHYPSNYTEDAFRFVLENLRKYIPKDIDKIIKKKGKYSYHRIYERIEKHLRDAPDVFEWDYYSYFKEHYPNPYRRERHSTSALQSTIKGSASCIN